MIILGIADRQDVERGQRQRFERSGQPARIELRGGLLIELLAAAAVTHRQLSRAIPTAPGTRELTAVLNDWPYPIPDQKITVDVATHARYQGRIYIMAAWPTPPRLALGTTKNDSTVMPTTDPAVPAGAN